MRIGVTLLEIFLTVSPAMALEPKETLLDWARASIVERAELVHRLAGHMIDKKVHRGRLNRIQLAAYLMRCANAAAGSPDGENETVPRNPEIRKTELSYIFTICNIASEKD
jgi:hypothetical protein